MSSEQPSSAPAPRMPADLSGRDPAQTLAGLIDVLDRADGVAGRPRPRTHRSAAHRSAAYRTGASRAGAVRTVPLRSVPPAPMARRPALWGAGSHGENLAWHAGPWVVAPLDGAHAPVRTPALRRLTRRLALWG